MHMRTSQALYYQVVRGAVRYGRPWPADHIMHVIMYFVARRPFVYQLYRSSQVMLSLFPKEVCTELEIPLKFRGPEE